MDRKNNSIIYSPNTITNVILTVLILAFGIIPRLLARRLSRSSLSVKKNNVSSNFPFLNNGNIKLHENRIFISTSDLRALLGWMIGGCNILGV